MPSCVIFCTVYVSFVVKVVMGGKVPETYYKLKNLKESANMEEYTHINVKKGSSLQLNYEVDKPGSIIRSPQQ